MKMSLQNHLSPPPLSSEVLLFEEVQSETKRVLLDVLDEEEDLQCQSSEETTVSVGDKKDEDDDSGKVEVADSLVASEPEKSPTPSWKPSSCSSAASPSVYDQPSLIVAPSKESSDERYGATVKECSLQASVTAFIAKCTIELIFENIHKRDLEAEFVLPLPPSATVTGYSLEFKGGMVPASMVEAKKAEKVYDEEIKKGKEVSIAQKVVAGGNVFKTKVHPIPARGTRRLSITYNQPLESSLNPDFGVLDLSCLKIPKTSVFAEEFLQAQKERDSSSTSGGGGSFFATVKRRISLIGRGSAPPPPKVTTADENQGSTTGGQVTTTTAFVPVKVSANIHLGEKRTTTIRPLFIDSHTGEELPSESFQLTEAIEGRGCYLFTYDSSSSGTVVQNGSEKVESSSNAAEPKPSGSRAAAPSSIRIVVPTPGENSPPLLLTEHKKVETSRDNADSDDAFFFALNDHLPASLRTTQQLSCQKNDNTKKKICVVWDASLSRLDAFTGVETKLMKDILTHFQQQQDHHDKDRSENDKFSVDLLIVRDAVEAYLGMIDISTVVRVVAEAPYDGATNLQALNRYLTTSTLSNYHRVLLFADGLSTLGEGRMQSLERDSDLLPPVFCFSSGSQVNLSQLQNYWSDLTGGSFIQLSSKMKQEDWSTIVETVCLEEKLPPRITSVRVLDSETKRELSLLRRNDATTTMTESGSRISSPSIVCTPSGSRTVNRNERFMVCGRVPLSLLLQSTSATVGQRHFLVRVSFFDPSHISSGSRHGRTVAVDYEVPFSQNGGDGKATAASISTSDSTSSVVSVLWAQQRISQLEVFPERHAPEILHLSREYGILSSSMSLLLLDTLDQHLEHDIEPHPARDDLFKEFKVKRMEQRETEGKRVEKKVGEVQQMWATQKTQCSSSRSNVSRVTNYETSSSRVPPPTQLVTITTAPPVANDTQNNSNRTRGRTVAEDFTNTSDIKLYDEELVSLQEEAKRYLVSLDGTIVSSSSSEASPPSTGVPAAGGQHVDPTVSEDGSSPTTATIAPPSSSNTSNTTTTTMTVTEQKEIIDNAQNIIKRLGRIYHQYKYELRMLDGPEQILGETRATLHQQAIQQLKSNCRFHSHRIAVLEGRAADPHTGDGREEARASTRRIAAVQDSTIESLRRTACMVDESESIGSEAAATLQQQCEQLSSMSESLDATPEPSLFSRAAASLARARTSRSGTISVNSSNNNNSSSSGGVSGNATVTYWSPNLPYMTSIKAAGEKVKGQLAGSGEDDAQVALAEYREYLKQRTSYMKTPSFYFDVAGHFISETTTSGPNSTSSTQDLKTRRALGVRILSNIAELGLENSRILRVMGYKLYEAKEWAMAREIFARIAVLRPKEPQSYRDLGLTFLESGWYQQALNLLWRTILMEVDGSFREIELECLWEIRDTMRRAERAGVKLALPPLLTSKQALLGLSETEYFPLDLRITLGWDTDNVDIDLHVHQPDGAEAYYGNRKTRIGGCISRDFTRGYGPESYILKDAGDEEKNPGSAGLYSVKARYYSSHRASLTGPTVAIVTVTTNFLRENQETKCTLVRLNESREQGIVGSVLLEKKSAKDPKAQISEETVEKREEEKEPIGEEAL